MSPRACQWWCKEEVVRAGASIWMCIRLVHIAKRNRLVGESSSCILCPPPIHPDTIVHVYTRPTHPHHTQVLLVILLLPRRRLRKQGTSQSWEPGDGEVHHHHRFVLQYVAAAATAHPTATIMRTGVLLFTLSAFGALSSSVTLCQAAVTAPPSSRYVSECIHPIPCS